MEMLPSVWNQRGAGSLSSWRGLAEALPKQSVEGKASLPTREEDDDEVPDLGGNFDEVSKKEADWIESTQFETSEEDKLEEIIGHCYFILWLFFQFLFMDLIKSWSLIFLSPRPLDMTGFFSFCFYTYRSSQLIKFKKPGDKVWNKG